MCALIIMAFIAIFGFGVFAPVRMAGEPPAVIADASSPPITATPAPVVVAMTPTPTAFVRTSTPAPVTPTPDVLVDAPELVSCEPIPETVSRALVDNYHNDFLTESRGWGYTASESPLKTVGTWLQNDTGSVGYLELLHYDCGIPPNAIDTYFNAETFPVFFAGYDDYELVIECALGDQRHFIFETAYQGRSYEARYWFEPLAPTRLAMFSLFSPVSEGATIRRLARQMYPDLPDCRNAGAG